MIKVVIFCCKLCVFLKNFSPIWWFEDARRGGQNSISSSPPFPPPPKKGMLDHSLCASTAKQLIDS